MGASGNGFVKYPRTPHLFDSTGTPDDKRLGTRESEAIISDSSLIVEEKLDGTNVGIHFCDAGKMILQCRGHKITSGMHPQYDLFKQWAMVQRGRLEHILENRYILFGEWMYAKHTIHYAKLPHYFFEFDIYDKQALIFLTLKDRLKMLAGSGILTVPILHTGAIHQKDLLSLVTESRFGSRFENPRTQKSDGLMEGLYVRTESDRKVTARAKLVRPEFIEKINQSSHWQHQVMVPNQLADGVDIW